MRRVLSRWTGPPTRRRRQPPKGNAPKFQIANRPAGSMSIGDNHKKEDPGARRGPGSFAGWVRGWGLGGTPPGVRYLTFECRRGSYAAKLFSRCCPAAAPTLPHPGPLRQIGRRLDRQIHLASVGKFQITQMDVEAPFAPAAAFDDVARADRKPVGEAICERTHDDPPGETPRQGHQCQINATVPRHRDKNRGLLWIAVDRPSNSDLKAPFRRCRGARLIRRSRCPAPDP